MKKVKGFGMGRPPGRPRKDSEEVEEVAEEEVKLTHKVISYTDYLLEAANILGKGGVEGMEGPEAKFNLAVSLLYSRNEVIATIQKGGETRFVVKI